MFEWLFGKHRPTGKTADILDILDLLGGENKGMNQTDLAAMIDEPEYVLRGMMDVLVDLHYVRMERRGNSKVYYII